LPYGFSVYQGVLVIWDMDYDQRVLKWIDSLPPDIRASLYCVAERKGLLDLKWRGSVIPEGFSEYGTQIDAPDDVWLIYASIAIEPEDRPSSGQMQGRCLPVANDVAHYRFLS
jgi:hypothetical protein